jgi:hypothetical protein
MTEYCIACSGFITESPAAESVVLTQDCGLFAGRLLVARSLQGKGHNPQLCNLESLGRSSQFRLPFRNALTSHFDFEQEIEAP